MSDSSERFVRFVVVLLGALVAAAVGWLLFVFYPADSPSVLGVLLWLLVILLGVRVAGRIAAARFPGYDVAEVAVEGPITRDGGGGGLPRRPRSTPADDIVEQIEAADGDDNARALLLKLDTPGGEVVPSDDIRLAAERFDGPTVAYTTDVCASGGYWIASGCDALYARDASIVGSIGVIGSQVNAVGLAEKLGLSYERFAAGKYKDAGASLKEMDDDERRYLQGIIDDYYENFVERVVDGRDLDPEMVRETEARIYLGEEALELGLVDALGTREDVEERLAAELGVPEVSVAPFEPERGLRDRIGVGARSVAYSFGAGVASAVADDDRRFEFKL